MPHPSILSTNRQSQLSSFLANNSYNKSYVDPLLASASDLSSFSTKYKSLLTANAPPSNSPLEIHLPNVINDVNQCNTYLEQIRVCAIQALGAVAEQIQKGVEGLDGWCEVLKDEVTWNSEEAEAIIERLNSSHEIAGRRAVGDLVPKSPMQLPPKIRQVSASTTYTSTSHFLVPSLELSLDSLGNIGKQLPSSLLGGIGSSHNTGTVITNSTILSATDVGFVNAKPSTVIDNVSPTLPGDDMPPPPPPVDDLPPPPLLTMDDLPPPPMDDIPLPPPPIMDDLILPPIDDIPLPLLAAIHDLNLGTDIPDISAQNLPVSSVSPVARSISLIPSTEGWEAVTSPAPPIAVEGTIVNSLSSNNISIAPRENATAVLPPGLKSSSTSQVRAKVLYNYTAAATDEITITTGESLNVIVLDAGDGWTSVESSDGQRNGLVPREYIELLN